MYSVRFNLGENYVKPYGMQRKIWTMSFDERGAFWTRLLRAKDRTDAVNRMLIWYRNKKVRLTNREKDYLLSCHNTPMPY